MRMKKNGLRLLFLAVVFLTYQQPTKTWYQCGGYCSGSIRISECVYEGEPTACGDPGWYAFLAEGCEAAGRAAGDGAAWFSVPECEDITGHYTTYCSYNDPTCLP